MLIGRTNLSNFNIGLNDFMQEYRKNITDVQNGKEGSKLGELPKIGLDNNNPEDQELVNDLKVLMNNGTDLTNTEQSLRAPDNNFGKVLTNCINDVNNVQVDADRKAQLFAAGGNIDVHSVMIAQEKAGLAMQLTMQVRNKILQAYQEVSRMNV
jgi:flagellar hook-basal body complex protein FliE